MNFLDERLPMRFWDKVQTEPNSGCWIWIGLINHGYGAISWQGSPRLAHRVAYITLVGDVPEGLALDHLCRTRCCVNPAHLEPVTNAKNTRRGLAGINNTIKRCCPRGHEYTEDNTVFLLNQFRSGKSRVCRICKNERNAAYRERLKVKVS